MIFFNLQNPDVQTEIKNLCRGKSGVYKITNLKTHKTYIGSALTKTRKENRLYFRFRNYFFYHHKFFPFKRAILEYGIHSFSWEILEFTEISFTRARESYYIQTFLPEYNILQSAENSSGYTHRLETKDKMKTIYSQERRKRIGSLNKGQKLASDVVKRISQAAQNRTQEQKDTHREACLKFNQKMFSKPTHVLHGETHQIIGTSPSLIQACRAWNGDYRTFKRAVKSGFKIRKFNIYVKFSS
jgi:group I intron endonuclease